MCGHDLAIYQEALSELLAARADGHAIAAALAADARFEPWRDYVATFELHLVEAIARMSARWGVQR